MFQTIDFQNTLLILCWIVHFIMTHNCYLHNGCWIHRKLYFYLFFLSRTGLLQSVASPAAMCVIKWSLSVPWVLICCLNYKRQVLMTLKLYLHDLDVHWEVGTGCRWWGLQPSRLWKDSNEGAEEIDVGGRFHSETVQGKKEWKRTGCWVCSCLYNIFSLLVCSIEYCP